MVFFLLVVWVLLFFCGVGGFDDGVNHGTSIVDGMVGNARDFESFERDYIDLGDMDQPADGFLTSMTWEACVKPET
jgi:hypothetical protein